MTDLYTIVKSYDERKQITAKKMLIGLVKIEVGWIKYDRSNHSILLTKEQAREIGAALTRYGDE